MLSFSVWFELEFENFVSLISFIPSVFPLFSIMGEKVADLCSCYLAYLLCKARLTKKDMGQIINRK